MGNPIGNTRSELASQEGIEAALTSRITALTAELAQWNDATFKPHVEGEARAKLIAEVEERLKAVQADLEESQGKASAAASGK